MDYCDSVKNCDMNFCACYSVLYKVELSSLSIPPFLILNLILNIKKNLFYLNDSLFGKRGNN